MTRLTANKAMRAGAAGGQRMRLNAKSGRDAIARERGFEDWEAMEAERLDRAQAKADHAVRQAANQAKSPEALAARDRQALHMEALQQLGRSVRFKDVDSYTAAVRGIDITDGVMRALAPNVHVLKLWRPGNGRAGVIDRDQMIAAADYSALRDSLLVGGAGRDPADIRVDGGAGGSTELALIHRMKAATQFKAASTALTVASIVPAWGRVIRDITDWVVLDGGRPLDDFTIRGLPMMKGEKVERACKTMLVVQGIGALRQHFSRG